jgi:hypothetical protein
VETLYYLLDQRLFLLVVWAVTAILHNWAPMIIHQHPCLITFLTNVEGHALGFADQITMSIPAMT